MTDFLPELPAGYRWQLCNADRGDITGEYLAECEADEARIWSAGDDVMLALKRTGDFGFWGPGGVDGEGGLRKWTIVGQVPEGLHDWEQFETLAQIPHRLSLPVEESA